MSRALLFVRHTGSERDNPAIVHQPVQPQMPPPGTIPSREGNRDTRWKEPDEMQQGTTKYWSTMCYGLDINVSAWGPTKALFVRGRIIEFPSLYALNWHSVLFIRRYCALLNVDCHPFSISASPDNSIFVLWSYLYVRFYTSLFLH